VPPALQASSTLTPGECVTLGRGVRRIVAGNAGMMTGPGTNTYLLGEREITVVDPGPIEPAHLQAIEAAAGAPIRYILTTHTHRDHSPLAEPLARRTGAQLIGLPPPGDGRQDESFRPQRLPSDGETLQLGDCEVTAIHTPGHASNCVCYLVRGERLLLTGDHVLQGVSPVILPPDGDMSAYMDSLEKLFSQEFDRIAPGHGELIGDGKQALQALRRHRLDREKKVLARLDPLGEASIEVLTPAVYDDVPADRHAWARLTLLAHLLKLQRDGRVVEEHGIWRVVRA
jgi:glyoxylase-like metal-dependent hydrolase (beta-lactamase superfamily II)